MQRVVFNANYMAFVDDAVDNWMRSALSVPLSQTQESSSLHSIGFDFMVKRVDLTWIAPVRFAERVDLDCRVVRWGTSSFDVSISGQVDEVERFTAVLTYVSIDPLEQRPVPVPEFVRSALGNQDPQATQFP